MIIGVDFDNTLVCYDEIFHRLALERGLITPDVTPTKTDVRNHLRRMGNEQAFTELQGEVYGPRILEATIFPGAKEFFRSCRDQGVVVKIISHKTRFPYAGAGHDLHSAARSWLEHNWFFLAEGAALPREAVFFEPTKTAKIARIRSEKCDLFIDDLPELLADLAFPAETKRVLFDSANQFPDNAAYARMRSWDDITQFVFEPSTGQPANAAIAAFARAVFERVARRLGEVPQRLVGGGNNRVYVARDDLGEQFLLKQYFPDAAGGRDRFESERLFYRFAAIAAPGDVPRDLCWDKAEQVALFEFINGRKLKPEEIAAPTIKAALDFLHALNRARESVEARALPIAAEACFTLAEHCATVDRRVERLTKIVPNDAIDFEARAFVETELILAWNELRATVLDKNQDRVAFDVVPDHERCVSPSDFGFHNCLRRSDGSLVFLDFEYAGWDDPAKMACDFFCQPALPVPSDLFEDFAAEVGRIVGVRRHDEFVKRCRLLLPLYRLKWCGILLNEFIAIHCERRVFALGEAAIEDRKALQLAAARRTLASLWHPSHGTAT